MEVKPAAECQYHRYHETLTPIEIAIGKAGKVKMESTVDWHPNYADMPMTGPFLIYANSLVTVAWYDKHKFCFVVIPGRLEECEETSVDFWAELPSAPKLAFPDCPAAVHQHDFTD
jgi:hypothetical protein